MKEEIRKFVETIDEVVDDLKTLSYMIGTKTALSNAETVSEKLERYEDTIDRLKAAFDTLRDEAGSKLIKDL